LHAVTINQSSVIFSVALFEVGARATLVEGGPTIMQCVTLTIPPAAANIGVDVVVTLSTVEGTGEHEESSINAFN
jgi:hypothetical protein